MVKVLRESNEIKKTPIECIKGATLLSKEEAENLLAGEERKCKGTQEAISNGLWVAENGNSEYWLRSAGDYNYGAYAVNNVGGIRSYYDVCDTYVGIRPAFILNIQSSSLGVGDSFEFGEYIFKIISNDLALCNVIIDVCQFNKSIKDGNDYETSYVKQRVDDWFNKTYAYEKKLSTQKYRPKSDDKIADENDWGF